MGECLLKNSHLVRPDPRVIFALTLVLSSLAVIVREDLRLMAALMLIGLICAAVLGVKFMQLLLRFRRLWQVLLVVAILRSIFTPYGTVFFQIRDIPLLTSGGVQIGLLVLLRLALFIVCGAMITCYPVRTLIQGMVQIKMPYEIAYMISIGVRFIPQLSEEMKDSLIALQLRGIVVEELGFKKRLKLYTYLMLPVIAASLQNAKELAMSMEMRAFRAMSERSSFYELSFKPRDVIMLCGVAVVGLGAVIVTIL